MPHKKAQGATEYLSTYGWAVLIVVISGIVLSESGVLKSQASVSSSGFGGVKPLLTTCEMSKGHIYYCVGTLCYAGLQCVFKNTVGEKIRITDVDAYVNGQRCALWGVTNQQMTDNTNNIFLRRSCGFLVGTVCPTPTDVICFSWPNNPTHTCSYLEVPKDGEFIGVVMSNSDPTNPNYMEGPCHDTKQGGIYDIQYSVTYEVALGGIVTNKTSSGRIKITGS